VTRNRCHEILAKLITILAGSGQGGTEKGEHAVAGDVGERGEFKGVVTTGKFHCAGMGAMAAEGIEHLAGKFGEHGGIVLAVDHERVAVCAHAAFDKRHRTDRSPVVAEFVDGDVVAETFPNMVGGHTLADNVGVIG